MGLARHFPTVVWVWRRLTSPFARRLWLAFAAITLVTSTALRVRSLLIARTVNSTLARLSQVQLDRTSKDELLRLMPDLRPYTPSSGKCPANECYLLEKGNWPSGKWMHVLALAQSKYLYLAGSALGMRIWDFWVEVEIEGGTVHKVGYSFLVDDGSARIPGIVSIAAHSVRGYPDYVMGAGEDESPDYHVLKYFKWPEQDLRIVFTPAASPQLVQHAFDLHLDCLWHLLGCRDTKRVLPLAWSDEEAIIASATARLRSKEPCPDRILPRRARDTKDILLAEVVSVDPNLCREGEFVTKKADYRLLEVLKGRADRPLKGLETEVLYYGPDVDVRVPNPEIELIYPGSKVLLFSSNYTMIGGPCEMVAATPSALATLRAALASPASHVDKKDRSVY